MSDDSVRPISESEISTWDLSADVVVAGYGIAGVTAAVEAARAGADVLVLERSGGWGGAASMAGGFIYLGGGTPLQKACGFEDTVENMKTFMKAALGPAVDDAKIDAYCEGSVDHYNWLVEAGVPFKEEFWGEPGWEPAHDEGLMYSGGENAAPFAGVVPPAPRGHLPKMDNKKTGERGGGYMLMKPLVETAEKLGVKAEYDIRVLTVVVNDEGRVVGVVARRYGRTIAVRAHRGVVLAMGSFAFDEEMVRDYVPALLGRPGSAVDAHDGRAIRIGQALGAATAHMDAAEVAVHTSPQLMVRGLIVNERGQRFIAEDTYPGRIGQAILFHQNNEAFLILDQAAYDGALQSGSPLPQPDWVCESVTELETEMGLPTGTLTSTVDVYNMHAENGSDPVFSKNEKWVRPIGTPIAGFDLRGMTSGFPLGGLKTDTDSRVLHVSGESIAGLFAAGRCTAGVCAGGYASGASLGDGSFFGRRAGVGAARG
ncbi:FAD-dependent oxidoreductase [Rhodococcus sp. (in: high G+C Gram-positive bacteria)]|uniref:FAD-dependent oxidoreductase n=1 Tax=Rhodococcus sp. TaxID=1831 RepID=UPI001A109DD5|nr:FAD-dependent oxidoreductase [Rhodococcus sp. (in: high G+C Gram-positive bacteria)]MBF0662056.1 FAD-dependent oxidoreductase [Rhodococcus sp. (in: high G+C Gram-positive bacteria)]